MFSKRAIYSNNDSLGSCATTAAGLVGAYAGQQRLQTSAAGAVTDSDPAGATMDPRM